MSTHSLGYQSSGIGFATSLSGKPKTHGWLCIWNYKPFRTYKINNKFSIYRLQKIELADLSAKLVDAAE
ncbi:hypothetical protein H5410_003554 [Solanum commersonii]|uniref:Uncharacterized protein n=1 Tax=Solanum commersonii TaxID=4109 RepID=A0A9J6B501_SOLCO|nr:hypothetical protein H5410_003554 [Solanum commersonii]